MAPAAKQFIQSGCESDSAGGVIGAIEGNNDLFHLTAFFKLLILNIYGVRLQLQYFRAADSHPPDTRPAGRSRRMVRKVAIYVDV